jgi:hypothetical protein
VSGGRFSCDGAIVGADNRQPGESPSEEDP